MNTAMESPKDTTLMKYLEGFMAMDYLHPRARCEYYKFLQKTATEGPSDCKAVVLTIDADECLVRYFLSMPDLLAWQPHTGELPPLAVHNLCLAAADSDRHRNGSLLVVLDPRVSVFRHHYAVFYQPIEDAHLKRQLGGWKRFNKIPQHQLDVLMTTFHAILRNNVEEIARESTDLRQQVCHIQLLVDRASLRLLNFSFLWNDAPQDITPHLRPAQVFARVLVWDRDGVMMALFSQTTPTHTRPVDRVLIPDMAIASALLDTSNLRHNIYTHGYGRQLQEMSSHMTQYDFKTIQQHLTGFWRVFEGQQSHYLGVFAPPLIKKGTAKARALERLDPSRDFTNATWNGRVLQVKSLFCSYGLRKELRLKKIFDVSLSLSTNFAIVNLLEHSLLSAHRVYLAERLPLNEPFMDKLGARVFVLRSGVFRCYDRMPSKTTIRKHLLDDDGECDICCAARQDMSCGTCGSLMCEACARQCVTCPYCREQDANCTKVLTEVYTSASLVAFLKQQQPMHKGANDDHAKT